jgi:DHA1 family multidrug resistance protein-like MFS transporter
VPDQKEGLFKHPVIITFLAIISSIEFIRMSLFLTFLPSFLTSLHYSTAALGMVISANLFADNLSKSAVGWLVDHKGPWPVLLCGSIATAIGVLLIMEFHQSLLLLILAAVLIGVGVAPTWPAAIAGSIQTVGEEKRATIISVISVVWLAGGGLGPVLMGFLIDSRMRKFLTKIHLPVIDAYKTGFTILAIIALLAIVICILGWFNWNRVPHIRHITAARNLLSKRERFKEVAVRLWKVGGLIPGMFFQTLSLGMLLPNLLPYATNKIGLTEAQYSILLLIGGIVVIAFMIPVGHLADHRGPRAFLVTGFLLAATSLLIMVTYGNKQNVWWIVGIVGLSYALIQPAWNALLAGSIPPAQRGVLMGLFMSVEGLGFAVGPLVGGYLGTLSSKDLGLLGGTGLVAPFYFSSFCLTLMAIVYMVYPFKHYQNEGN